MLHTTCTLAIFFFWTALVPSVTAGAPGDADSFCTDTVSEFDPPTFPPNSRVLMDSYNYINLLPPHDGAVWQMVDNDDNNVAGGGTEWSQNSNVPCRQSVTVCGFNFGPQENWLITQYISTVVNGTRLPQVSVMLEFALFGCDSLACQRTFVVNTYETSTEDNAVARDVSNYQLVTRIAAADGTGQSVQTRIIDVDLNDNMDGFYLAITDETTCIAITRVLVFYTVSPGTEGPTTSSTTATPTTAATPTQVDTAVISFEQSSYEIAEDIGRDDFALRVCVDITNLTSERIIAINTASGSAQGGEDYIESRQELLLRPGDVRQCIGIVILEDSQVEADEFFDVIIEGSDVFSTVIILDDDDASFRYIGDTPMVSGAVVSFDLMFGNGVLDARCALLVGTRIQSEVDCTSGKAIFTNLRQRSSEFTPRITIIRKDNVQFVDFHPVRNLRLGVRGACSVHLINEGIVTTGSVDGSTTIEFQWGLSAPSDVVQSEIGFVCSLDGGQEFNCTSPYQTGYEAEDTGTRTLVVHPTMTGGCVQSIGRTIDF